jgi:amino acid adenylation domain-containing protein
MQEEKKQGMTIEEKRELIRKRFNEKANSQEEEFPLSYGQRALWFINESTPESKAYNISIALNLLFPIDREVFQKALQLLIERHTMLRTKFTKIEGKPVEYVKQFQKITLGYEDVTGLTKERVRERVNRFHDEPFDLENGPIVRFGIFKVKEDENIFVFCIHHIAGDFTSLIILQEELFSIYNALLLNRTPNLEPVKHSFKEYVTWEREFVESAEGKKSLEYWKNQLSGELEVLQLPSYKQNKRQQTVNGSRVVLDFPDELTAKLRDLCAKSGTTIFTLLLAGYQVLLQRYCNQSEIIVGIPVSERSKENFANMIGYLINMAPIRTDLRDNKSFHSVLDQVKDKVMNAILHAAYPFPLVVEQLNVKRVMGSSPVFQTTFEVLKNNNIPRNSLVSNYDIPQQQGQFDISLMIQEGKEKLSAFWLYNTELLDEAYVKEIATHYVYLLEQVVNDELIGIKQIDMLTKKEKEKLKICDSEEMLEKAEFIPMISRFEEQVLKNPKFLAITTNKRKFTYEELNSKANQIAHYLEELNTDRKSRIGVCFNPSAEMILALLAIQKLGMTYVPMDVTYPKDRIQYIVEDSGIGCILTFSKMELKDMGEEVKRINLDTMDNELSNMDSRNLVVTTKPTDIAYILYTSGSTGKPKGVTVYHKGLSNYLDWCSNEYIEKDDDLQQPATFIYLPIVFDASITCLYTPLINGRYLLIPEKQGIEIFDDPDVQRGEFSFVKMTPAHLAVLKERLPIESLKKWTKKLIVGGEALLASHLVYLKEQKVPWTIMNEYGPTETVVGSSVYSFGLEQEVPENIPIGKPIINTRIYIMNEYGQNMPIGSIGEIVIGGYGVAQGYLNKEDLTKKNFIKDPFHKEEKVYRTGDLGAYMLDGNLMYCARKDDQIKIRGYRIEIGEVEAALGKVPQVLEVAVVAKEDAFSNKMLVAYYTSSNKEELDITKLIECISKDVPGYMIPSRFIHVKELPLTHNGKVDKKKLQTFELLEKEGEGREQLTVWEKRLLPIWEKILNQRDISVTKGFTDLGGHSLLAVQLISIVRKQFEVDIPVMKLYPNGTLKDIASQVEKLKGTVDEIQLEVEDNSTCCILLKQGINANKHVFFIHPGTGVVQSYNDLVQNIDTEYNCWGIEANFSMLSKESVKIEDLATMYKEEIQKIQSEGTYYIAGWCVGGTIAFEVVHQLEREFKTVLLLISTVPPQDGLREQMKEIDELEKLEQAISFNQINYEETLSFLPLSMQWAISVKNIRTKEGLLQYIQAYRRLHESRCDYFPKNRIQSKCYYFEPSLPSFEVNEWKQYMEKDWNYYLVSGTHDTILQGEGMFYIATQLNQILSVKTRKVRRCTRCTLPETYPKITFDKDGVCNYCHEYDREIVRKEEIRLESEEDLIKALQKFKNPNGKYDVLVPLSGGVDSSVTLIKLVKDYNLRPLAFHNDHGYEDPIATANVQNLCKALDVDLIIKQQDLGFMKKLWRYTHQSEGRNLSSCFVCGGIIYANSLEIADKYDIPLVINGYSKGQADMMDDKGDALEAWAGLLNEFQKDEDFFKEFMNKQEPMKKQIVLSKKEDLYNELPKGKHLVIPFYVFKFNKTDKVKLREYCTNFFDWKPMELTYPSRTTNCTMVWLNTYVDLCKMGYSMYDEEYAGIVRGGDMEREQAIEDLEFHSPEMVVKELANEVGTNIMDLNLVKEE